MDIKELKFLDIGTATTKPNCEQGASTETGVVPPGGHSHTSRVTRTPETSSTSHLSAAPVTILRRGKYLSDKGFGEEEKKKQSYHFQSTLTKTKHFACQPVGSTSRF